MKQIFDMIPIDNTLQSEWHFSHFVLSLKLLSGDQSQSLRDASNELLNTHTKVSETHNAIHVMDTLEVWEI